MPLMDEPYKPRLCHDERFLNLYIRDLLLPLDYISNLPRCVAKNQFQSTMDDKTSYDHVEPKKYSILWAGFKWLVFCL